MEQRWRSSSTCVFNVNYHLIWCPKYRRKVLVGEIESRLKELLLEKSGMISIDLKSMEIMPDHVHLFVQSSPIYAIHYIVNQLKGYTSRILRAEFKHLKLDYQPYGLAVITASP